MKIVQAVNSMIANKPKITNVILGRDGDFYFLFGTHKWSVGENSNGYYLRYYPGEAALEEIAAYVNMPWQSDAPIAVSYSTGELNSREASQSFSELYRVVQEKLYNVDTVLDEIIGDDNPF